MIQYINTMTEKEPQLIIDARGKLCPEPILLLSKNIKKVKPGDIVEIWAEDDAAVEDIPRWAKRTGNEFLGYKEDKNLERKLQQSRTVRRFLIRRLK